MCLKDLPATGVVSSKISLSTTPTVITEQLRARMTLVLSAPLAGRVSIGQDPNISDGEGITIPSGVGPVRLNVEQDGELVQRRLYGVLNTGTSTMAVTEVIVVG